MIKKFISSILLLACAVTSLPAHAQEAAATPPLDCSSGPLHQTYGVAPWLVFACSDNKSVVVVSAPGNKGNPFFFKLFVKDGVRQVVGEGAGSKKNTAAAYQELIKLSEADIAEMISAANAVPKTLAK